MVERYAAFTNPLLDSMNAGLRVPVGRALGAPATSVGLDNLSPTSADTAIEGQRPGRPAMQALSELDAPRAPTAAQRLYYPATDEFYAGGRLFKRGDIEAMTDQSRPPVPPPPGGVPIPEASFQNYVASLSERRGTGELLGLGLRQVGEMTIGGVGSLAEMAGATEVGPAIRGFAQEAFGQSPSEQMRSQLIAENSTIFERIVDAAIQSGPTLAAVLAGGGVAGLGLRAAGAGSGAITAGATVGAGTVSFPMHISSFYDAAVRNNYDVTDPAVKSQILAGAITNTMLDSVVPGLVARSLSRPVREAAEAAGQEVARSALRNALAGTARVGMTEGLTEATQSFLEMTVFDPQVRSMMTASDWKALAPYIAQTYGEDLLVSFGAGALLGGGVGGVTNFRATGRLDELEVENIGDVAAKQAEEAAAPAQPTAQPALDYSANIPPGIGGPDLGQLPPTAQDFVPQQGMDFTPNIPPGAGSLLRDVTTLPPAPVEQADIIAQRRTDVPAGRERLRTRPAPAPARAADPQPVSTTNRVEGNQQVTDITLDNGETFTAPGRLNQLQVRQATLAYNAQQAASQGVTLRGAPSYAVTGEGQVTRLPMSDGQTITLPGRITEPAEINAAVRQYNARLAPRPIEEVVTEAPAAPPAAPEAPTPGAPPIEAVVTPPAPAAPAARPSLTSQTAQGIERGMAAFAEGGRRAGRQRVAELIQQGTPVTYRNPEAVAAAKADPDQIVVDNPDGSVTVTGIRVEPGGPWVGTAPAAPPAPSAAAPTQPSAEGVATGDLPLFRATVPGRPDAPDGFMYLADNEKGAQGGAGAPVRQVTTRFDNLLQVGSRSDLDAILGIRNPNDIKRANEARAAGYDGVAITRNAKSKSPWTEYFVLYPDRVVDATPPTPPAPPTPPGKARVQRQAAEPKPQAPKEGGVARGRGRPRAEAPPPALPTITVDKIGRSPRGADVPFQIITLSDGRVVRMRNTGSNFAQVWTFMRTGDVIGEGIKSEDAAARVAELASQGALPDAVVEAEAEVVAPLTKEEQAAQRAVQEGYVPLEQEVDDFIAELESSTDKFDRAAAISGLQGTLAEPAMTPALRRRVRDYLASLGAEVGAAGLNAKTDIDPATAQLSQMIEDFNAAPGDITGSWQKQFRDLVAEVRRSDPEAMLGDRKLLSYAKANGDPNFVRVDGVRQIGAGGFSLANWNTIDGVVDLDGKPVTPMASGRVQLLVRNFVAKLARKPTITIARNQADLRARFPQLYARAVAARPQGDFDTALAMGYSFGDGQVIVFSDRIATEQQLNFVLAHESMGHYGLRAIMPGDKFDALMEKIYTESPAVKTAADAAMAVRPNMSRAEAVEEYLSDYAAVLETSIVARMWNGIKGFLNKLGIRTGDEMVRYLLDQSRRYVRYGTGVTFNAQTVAQRLHAVETMGDTGRFSVGPKLRDVNNMAALQMDTIGGLPMNFQEAWQDLKRQGVNSLESWDNFKSTFLSLANFRSRQNPGLLALEKLLDETRNLSMATKVEFNERLALVLNRAIAGEVGGISDAQTARVNQMLYAAQRFNVAQVRQMGDLGNVPLFRMENGTLVPNQPEIARLKALGTRTLAQMRDGFEFQVSFEEGGKTVTKMERFPGIKGLTERSIEWRGYQKIREAMDEIELRLLKARYQGALDDRDLAFRQIAGTVPDGELTTAERAAMTTLAKTYGDLYTANVQQDESGRAVLDGDYQTYANDILRTANAALIGQAGDRFDALRALLTEPRQFMKGETTDLRRELPAIMDAQAADDLIAQLQGFKSRMRVDQNRFVVQNKIKQVILAELASKDADKFTKRTIATGYTPVLREGAYQMRVEATVNGRTVRLQDGYREQLVYSQFENAAQSMEMADRTNALFKGNKFEAMYYDQTAGEYRLGEVELRAVSERALDAVAAPPQLNLNEFIRGLRQFDINLSPEKMEDVIVALTKQNSAARNRLERVFTPGADLDGIMATMRHIESRASTISKTLVRPRLAELMDRSMSSTMELWNADVRRPDGTTQLEWLKKRAEDAAADATMPREAKVDAQREYDLYAYMYEQTNPGGGKPRRANQFYNEAARTVAFLDGNQNVDESDFGSGPMVSRIRAATSMMQLGGSVATGALNILSVYTNGIPYLSSYNSKTGFGGGFSAGKVVAELHRAAAQVGGPGITSGQMNTAEFYNKVANSPALQKQYKLKAHEAAFISQEILDGAMIPAQSNALVGTARGRTTQGWQQKFLDGWMWTFNVTEQASRRTFGLTAYRLEFARKRAAGMSEADAAAAARDFAVQALQFTMGEYSVLNRPPAWRSGIQSFAYMYKVFPTTSMQMFANMSRGGKVGMLAGLWLLTGLAGLPFAEDLEDVVDTLAQKLKVSNWQGARYETAQFLDNIFPGMSPLFLKGVVNNYMPADIASRTSLGNLLPGTDILLAGADVSRGLGEIGGPAPSMLLGTAQTAADLLALPFSTTTTIETVAREAPVTMIRALGDAYAYTQSGSVVDRRGYTVTDDMHAGTILARTLGFYPSAAANQYEIIRAAKRMTDYQREVVTGYRTAWVSAMARGDREFAREIEQSVRDWNDGARGTALEIRNFVPNSQRALREASRPAAERALRSAPDAAEQDLQRMVDLLTLN